MKIIILLILAVAPYLYAEPLEDNSFLVEEAYNQEAGVVQFINVYQKQSKAKDWNYTFINEIPVGGQADQFSYEIPYSYVEALDKTQVGDLKLNYRREIIRNEMFVTTARLSIISNTGDYKLGFGNGSIGYETSLLNSVKINSAWSQHWNVGAQFVPSAKNTLGDTADITKYFWALSNIYFVTDGLNVMLEVTSSSFQDVAGPSMSTWSHEDFVSPSLRYAIDVGDWQFVPGIAAPIGLGDLSGQNQILGYFSIEGKVF